MENTSYVFLPDGVFYLVTTVWIFDVIILCENSTNQFNESNRIGHSKGGTVIMLHQLDH